MEHHSASELLRTAATQSDYIPDTVWINGFSVTQAVQAEATR